MTNRLLAITAAGVLAACAGSAGTADTTRSSGDVVSSGPIGATTKADTPRAGNITDAVAPGDSALALRIDKTSYKPGDRVTLSLVNPTSDRYAYNPCTRVLERESGGSWSEVKENRMCTMIAHVLEARSTRAETTELSRDIAAGRYRIIVALSLEGAGTPARSTRLTSQPFSVTP